MITQRSNKYLILCGLMLIVTAGSAIGIHQIHLRHVAATAEKLQDARINVTQWAQRVHVLQAFAAKLRRDTSLRAAVESVSAVRSNWQSPLTRTRLRLTDVLREQSSYPGVAPDSVKLWWPQRSNATSYVDASPSNLNNPTSAYVELTADVTSVSSGIQLLELLSSFVHPFPLHTMGCQYHRRDEVEWLGMRCVMQLTAWSLPVLNTEPTTPLLDSHADPEPLAVPPRASWRLFSNAPAPQSVVDVQKPLPPKPIKPEGIVTGPAGTLVIPMVQEEP